MSLQKSGLELEKQTSKYESIMNSDSGPPKNKKLLLLEKIENLIVATLLFLILITVIAQVYSRFITGNSITWAGELTRFIAVWMVFIGSAIAIRRNLHIQVTNLYNVVSHNVGMILIVLRSLVILAFLIIIFVGSLDMLEIVSLQTSPGLGIKMNMVYMIVPISVGLMMIIILLQTLISFRRKRG